MLLDLNSFVKVDFLREELSKSCVMVTTTEEADAFAFSVSRGEMRNVIFEKSNLKNYCFAKIREYTDVNIVNCNSSLERFCESLDSSRVTIFDNVNVCKNLDILSLVVNKKGILVC